MIPIKILEDVVKKYGLVKDEGKWGQAKKDAIAQNKDLVEIALGANILDENALFLKIAEYLGLEFVSFKGRDISQEVINLVPNPLALTHNVVAYDKTKSEVLLAMTDPTDIEAAEFIRRKTGLEPKIAATSPTEMKEALRMYRTGFEEEFKIIQEKSAEAASSGDLKKVAEELPIVNVVNSILEHAIYEGASDIHVEPNEKEMDIRYRIDGVLRPIMTLPKSLQNGIVARVKILANLKLDEHMAPQDGRFKIQIQNDRTAFRVSIIPVYDGEKIVMRLLPEGAKSLTLDQLGFLEQPKQALERAIKKPNGMILVTGPTGSGKTTTLYSILSMLNQPGVNISTIEDPIEYRIKGINQSQINPKVGFTFATGLRAFLRQDPNIIMVGEIRDQETAEISVHAAMTGHLVLSTLHTNDAPTTLPRLIDMGVPPFLVAYTINLIVAQRLLRKICTFCKSEFKLDKNSLNELAKVFGVEKILNLFKQAGVLKAGETSLEEITFYQGAGCAKCNQSGYKGRLGIYEVLEMNNEITKKINEHATAAELKTIAQKFGMLTMSEDGLIKAKMGITSISEILRVTKD
ncbi:MAG: ATPase, T2SS/T4P/T4SS family [Candidatus Magasanikbacteria bacterium]|nr:ATPase, T2SS/T4P/T4SS family [Candidatus Magasanikbacteria bacterium]